MERLKDRVAVVTGSGQGMGLAIARACAGEGAKIVIADIHHQTIEAAVEEIKERDRADAIGIRMDVTNKAEVEKGVKKVLDTWGRIDLLVNNAGGALNAPHKLEEIEEKHWDLVVNVNLKGAFFCCQQVIPAMVKQGRGAIVNMSALAGHWRASLAGVQYTAAKAGIEVVLHGENGIREDLVGGADETFQHGLMRERARPFADLDDECSLAVHIAAEQTHGLFQVVDIVRADGVLAVGKLEQFLGGNNHEMSLFRERLLPHRAR